MRINGNEKKLKNCFDCFKQFEKDFPALSEGIIKRIAFDHYKWTETDTSLAEYFYWLGEEKRKETGENQLGIKGGFWDPIAAVFRVKKRTLSNEASRIKKRNPLGSGETEKFKEIKKTVEEYRKKIQQQLEQEQRDRKIFSAIKTFMDEANGDNIKEIRTALEKIKTVIT